MAVLVNVYLLGLIAQVARCALQAPRRVGMQAFRLMDTLWMNGGQFLHEDASVATELEPTPVSYDLTKNFIIWDGPIKEEHRDISDTPTVTHGFTFSNLVDRAWLFGGKPVGNGTPTAMANDIWRFEPQSGDSPWTQIPPGTNSTQERPYRGAGCNVPDLRRGYYLGGITDDPKDRQIHHYHHWLFEFDMESEKLQAFPVPQFVPVVNQSLVFLDTGTRSGALVALGGSVETGNGTLSKAQLTSVFIFDIKSRTWIEQPVTGWNGNLDEDGTLDDKLPDGGIPRSRVSACAAVGSAQDKTSHNIFYLGGTNETRGTGDSWILSLPSAVWIKARADTDLNGAKTENSCTVINGRYLWMTGGCFLDPRSHIPCMGYSWNTLIYDMWQLRTAHYTSSDQGYLIADNISAVVGGNLTGRATSRAPIFTNFSNSILKELFTPPDNDPFARNGAFTYDDRTAKYVITFLTLPVVVAMILCLVSLAMRMRLNARSGMYKPSMRKAWRPSVLSPAFLIFINLIPLLVIALIALLEYTSHLPDDSAEHWSGGLDSDGVWTGRQFESKFIRAPTLARPPQGLISFYYDQKPAGTWSQRNAIERIGTYNYFAFTYLPTLIAVLYGRLWKVLDDEVKRVDKYIRLKNPSGEKGKDSLFLEYHTFWIPLCMFQALRRGHWHVAISSLGLILGAVVAPIVQNYVFVWTLYSGAQFPWQNRYSWLVALVDPLWSKVLIGVLGTTFLCSLCLLVLLPWRSTGLLEDPKGLAAVVNLIPAGPGAFQKSSNKQRLSELRKDLGGNRFQLVSERNHPAPVLKVMAPAQAIPARWPWLRNRPTSTITSHLKRTLTTTRATLKPLTHTFHRYLIDYPLSFAFRPEILTLWLLLLAALLTLTAMIAYGLDQNYKDLQWNYTIPLSPSVYLILAIIIQSIADVFDYSVRALHPFYTLHKGAQSASILFEDYTVSHPHSVIPIVDLFNAFRRGHHLIYFTVLASIATVIVAVFLGSLQLSSSYYGATSFSSDQLAATGSSWLVVFIFLVYAGIGWKIRVLRRGMRRPVETVGGVIPYVAFSRGLRADLDSVRGLGDVKERVSVLEGMGGRYALGRWVDEDGEAMFGVERQYEGLGRVDTEGVL